MCRQQRRSNHRVSSARTTNARVSVACAYRVALCYYYSNIRYSTRRRVCGGGDTRRRDCRRRRRTGRREYACALTPRRARVVSTRRGPSPTGREPPPRTYRVQRLRHRPITITVPNCDYEDLILYFVYQKYCFALSSNINII